VIKYQRAFTDHSSRITPSLKRPTHFEHTLLTLNAAEENQLHFQFPDHPGILAVYQDNNPAKDMSYTDIVQAIANLEQLGIALAGGFWPLNRYRW